VTEITVQAEGWWTWWILWSSEYVEAPEHRIWLAPGDSFSTNADLADILAGCPSMPNGLPSGEYTVQLRSEVGLVLCTTLRDRVTLHTSISRRAS
jgi:hypothetical protein